MRVRLCLLALTTIVSSPLVWAQEGSSNSAKSGDLKPATNGPKGEDVDTIITNVKMRAETGSKSKYSVSTSFGYSAGSLSKPLGEVRPNITGGTGSTDVTALGGSISGKYAFTTQQALLAGVGMRWITPFTSSKVPDGYNGSKVDIDNPGLTYQYLYRWAGIQAALAFSETFFTASNLVNDGYVTTWGLAQNNIIDLGTSGFSIGVNTYVGLGYFNKNTPQAKVNQSDYSMGFTPSLEYHVSDRLNLRMDSNLFIYQHVRSEIHAHTYQRQDVIQSLSLGYAITRDFYVSPGISWVPGRLSAESTVVSLGGNINLF